MRTHRVTLIIAAVVAVVTIEVALLWPRVSAAPEVRLTRLLRVEPQPSDASGDQYASSFLGMADLGAETWKAEFEIRVPSRSCLGLTNGEIGVEMLGLDGGWSPTATVASPVPMALTRLAAIEHSTILFRTIRLSLPAQVRSCRFTVGFRLPTRQERCMHVLMKSCLWRRFPGPSAWITKRLPTTERWLVCRREVQVAGSPIAPEGQNGP